MIAILRKELISDTKSPDRIAAIVALAVITGKIPMGTVLCTQRQLAHELQINLKIIERTWKILKNMYNVIMPDGTHGTRIIDQVNGDHRNLVKSMVANVLDTANYIAKFDEESLYGFTIGKGNFDPPFRLALRDYEKIESVRRDLKVIPQLLTKAVDLAAERLHYSFSPDEVYYGDDYQKQLIYICDVVLTGRKEFIVPGPTRTMVSHALQRSKYEASHLYIDPSDVNLEALNNYCDEHEVGLIYLSPAAPYPCSFELSHDILTRLKKLQVKHGFTILLDDRYGTFKISKTLFDDIATGTNSFIIYLGRMSSLNQKIATANIIAGPKLLIGKIKKMFISQSTQLSPALGYALLKLMHNGELVKYESQVQNSLKARVALVKDKLIGSGLFQEDFIYGQQAWFFYLEPVTGFSFPDDVYDKLARERKFIMSREQFSNSPFFDKGLLISISAFETNSACLLELDKFLAVIKKMMLPD